MAKDERCCVLTLPLITEPWQDDIIEKRFLIMEHLKNSLIAMERRKLNNLRRTKAFRKLEAKIDAASDEEKPALYSERKKMLREAGFSEYAFKDDMQSRKSPHSRMQEHFSPHIYSQIALQAAKDVWQAFEKHLYKGGKEVHFHKHGTLRSVACENAGKGMDYKDGIFTWNGGKSKGIKSIRISIRVRSPENDYEREMLKKPVKYMRIVRKWMKSRYKYYLQLTFAGSPIQKERQLGVGSVGIDIGPQTIAVSSAQEVFLSELAEQVNANYRRKIALQRKMDRSKRSTNPEKFNSDGTYRRAPRGTRYHWNFSNRYKRLAGKVRELERKNADIRKYEHTVLANRILSMGDTIYVEKMSFSGLQRRAKQTKINKRGRYARKKRFGKSLANKAPATLLLILKTKAEQNHQSYNEVKTAEFRASQLDHTTGEYTKAKLSARWKTLSNGDRVQRDLYSAFLLMNSDSTCSHSNLDLCRNSYGNFKELHDGEIARIQEAMRVHPHKKYPSSFGIT